LIAERPFSGISAPQALRLDQPSAELSQLPRVGVGEEIVLIVEDDALVKAFDTSELFEALQKLCGFEYNRVEG
jgi:hypothetical protein